MFKFEITVPYYGTVEGSLLEWVGGAAMFIFIMGSVFKMLFLSSEDINTASGILFLAISILVALILGSIWLEGEIKNERVKELFSTISFVVILGFFALVLVFAAWINPAYQLIPNPNVPGVSTPVE